jgi:hypothetical protein
MLCCGAAGGAALGFEPACGCGAGGAERCRRCRNTAATTAMTAIAAATIAFKLPLVFDI